MVHKTDFSEVQAGTFPWRPYFDVSTVSSQEKNIRRIERATTTKN